MLSHIKKNCTCRQIICVSCGHVALAIAWSPNDTINLVGNAWAGFGAAFSPLVLFFILEKLTRAGAISGMIAGALVVIIWIVWVKPLANIELFGMYEIIPGFISSVIVTC